MIFADMGLYLIAVAGRWTWEGRLSRHKDMTVEQLMLAMDTDQRDVAEAMHKLLNGGNDGG